MASPVVIIPAERYPEGCATVIADRIQAAIDERGRCFLMLCGGSTPAPIYQDLVGRTIRWPAVQIYFGDERAVPPDHPDSNYGLARRTLLAAVPIPADAVFRMEAERAGRDRAAAEYADILPERIDVLLLGVGPDGHTASLFPGTPSVQERRRLVLAVARPPRPLLPQVDRMTITPVVIAAAREVIVLVRGTGKADLLREILEGPLQAARLPAQLARSGSWLLDPGAASRLTPKEMDTCNSQ
jgi:6-phosphogluconolactonase